MVTNTDTETNLLYLRIANNIMHQVKNDILKVGDKLPSLRTICHEQGVSMSTATQAYLELEKKGLIESRPQSGYYVCYSFKRFPAIPETSKPISLPGTQETEQLIAKVYSELNSQSTTSFALGAPASQLLPVAKLNKCIVKAMRTLPGSGIDYEHVQGSIKLRQQIAKSSLNWHGKLIADDVVTTAGCMNAIAYCMMALTQRGDTIAVESPVFFGVLQLAQSLGLKVLELPTHAETGIDPDALKKVFEKRKIKLCLLISNFSNPVGSCMPDDHKKQIVRLLQKHNIPLIEDDLYADIYFGNHRPLSCKTFDESGLVLWCGSFSKTLAPGYRVGWVAPGKFKGEILRAKLYNSISSATLTQEVLGDFLENGRYEHHLRKLRQTLHTNSLQYIRAISEYFPDGTKVSRPQGGFMLWVELDKKIDTAELYDIAIKQKISIAPGKMFTLQKQYYNYMRLSYGQPWNEKIEASLKQLGRMIKNF